MILWLSPTPNPSLVVTAYYERPRAVKAKPGVAWVSWELRHGAGAPLPRTLELPRSTVEPRP